MQYLISYKTPALDDMRYEYWCPENVKQRDALYFATAAGISGIQPKAGQWYVILYEKCYILPYSGLTYR